MAKTLKSMNHKTSKNTHKTECLLIKKHKYEF